MRRALVDGYVQRGTRATSDRRVRADPSYACSGRHLRNILVITRTSWGGIGEAGQGVDRGLGLGTTIREQRGRGNVMEATINCEVCEVVDNWLGGIESW